MPDFADCHALVLAGGSGSRLWPLSRSLFPKQFLTFDNNYSLLQLALIRILRVFKPENVHIVTGEDHVFEVCRQIRVIDPALEAGILSEPRGRNTLPATLFGLDAIWDDDAKTPRLAVFAADHHIPDTDAFAYDIKEGLNLAGQGYMVTFGIVPKTPETGYGYIERGNILSERSFLVSRFVEKPDRARAESFLRNGKYLWNSGIFVFPGQKLIDAVHTLQPQLAAWWDNRREIPLSKGYATLPAISLDYGIMERAKNVAVIEADFAWDDLGSWEALYRLSARDKDGCVIWDEGHAEGQTKSEGEVLALDCKDSLLISRSGCLAAIGLKDIVAVQTRDATLICARNMVQKVKDVVKILKDNGSPLAFAHLTVKRPWGSYTVLEEGRGYKIKRITVEPHSSLSLQYHKHRAEHWVVVSGFAEVCLNDEVLSLSPQEYISIPKLARHRLSNRYDVPLDIIEIQSGDYLEEDDIVRIDDVYNRN